MVGVGYRLGDSVICWLRSFVKMKGGGKCVFGKSQFVPEFWGWDMEFPRRCGKSDCN